MSGSGARSTGTGVEPRVSAGLDGLILRGLAGA